MKKQHRASAFLTDDEWKKLKLESVLRRCDDADVISDAIKLATGQRELLLASLRRRLDNPKAITEAKPTERIAPPLTIEDYETVHEVSGALRMPISEFIRQCLDVYFDQKALRLPKTPE